MKRVRLIAAFPIAVGMTVPGATVAMAAATGAQQSSAVRPDTFNKCLHSGQSDVGCFNVHGASNDVNTTSLSFYSQGGTGYTGYKNVPGFPAKSKWKTGAMTRSTAHPAKWRHHWSPECSFATGTTVYGYTNNNTTRINAGIHGNNFTGLHNCA